MPKGRPEDYKIPGKPSSGVKPANQRSKRPMPAQASPTAMARNKGQQGMAKRRRSY
jgi:hypothetical protein